MQYIRPQDETNDDLVRAVMLAHSMNGSICRVGKIYVVFRIIDGRAVAVTRRTDEKDLYNACKRIFNKPKASN